MKQDRLRIAQLQTLVTDGREDNIQRVKTRLAQVDTEQLDLVCLGEMFACPYDTAAFPRYAEAEGGETYRELSQMARDHGVYLSAGSVPERDEEGRIYNTAYVFDPRGRQIAKHRKLYLFEVDIPGGQRFRESETLSAGDRATVFETPFGPVGLCICFDLRFPELAREMVDGGARLIIVPAAFNMTTGPAHWELLFRSRAVDNQCFTVGTSPARNPAASYVAWGHSLVVDPFGRVLNQMDEGEGVQFTEICLSQVEEIRQQLPLLKARSQRGL